MISQPKLRIEKGPQSLELYHDVINMPRVLVVPDDDDLRNLNVSGMDEEIVSNLKGLIVETRGRTPDQI